MAVVPDNKMQTCGRVLNQPMCVFLRVSEYAFYLITPLECCFFNLLWAAQYVFA